MFQQLLLVLVSGVAIVYLGRLVYKSFQSKSSCASGCGKCGTADLAIKTNEANT